MDFEKNPLVNDISRCRREVKRWLALVALTLAALLTAVCIDMMQLSPASREIVNFLMIASVMAIICSLLGVKQSNDHCRSVQYWLSVFEAMKKDLEGVENKKDDLQKALQQFQSSYLMLLLDFESVVCDKAKLQKELDATKQRLEDTRDELVSAGYAIESIRNGFCQAKKNAKALQDSLDATEDKLEQVKDWLCETDDALVQTRDRLNETKRQRDDLQNKLNTARRISVRRLIERNELQKQNDELRKELNEAKMNLEWSRGLHADAKEQAASLENVLKNLNEAMEKAEVDDLREKLKMVINRLSAEDLR